MTPSCSRRSQARTVRVGIIGLGTWGCRWPGLRRQGLAVLGFDVDPAKVAKLKRGRELHRPHHRRDDPPNAAIGASRRPTASTASTSRTPSSSASPRR